MSLQITPTSCVFRSIVASWEVSAIGHPVVLPLSVCEELLKVMEESNATLPASMRCMRSYEVRRELCASTRKTSPSTYLIFSKMILLFWQHRAYFSNFFLTPNTLIQLCMTAFISFLIAFGYSFWPLFTWKRANDV